MLHRSSWRWLPLLAVLLGAPAARAQGSLEDRWTELIANEQIGEADALCTGWLDSEAVDRRVEAHKCLANVEIARARGIVLEGDDLGGGQIRAGFAGDPVDRALGHLDEALRLAPGDLSIHQGRLYVLLESGRFAGCVGALQDSLARYRGPDALEAWLDYAPRFFDARQFEAGAAFMQVLEKRYPDEHRVVANIGGFLAALGDDERALPYAEKAVALAPQDPINNWNLGLLYEFTARVDDADRQFRKSLALPSVPGQTAVRNCVHYAEFAEQTLSDFARACAIYREHCPRQAPVECR